MISSCRLSAPKPVVLEALSRVPFEVAVGVNGAFWVKAGDVRTTAVVTNAILNSEFLNDREIASMCENVLKTLSS